MTEPQTEATWTVAQIQEVATDKIKAYVATLDPDRDATLVRELNEVREDIEDNDFVTDTQGVHLLALLLGVRVASPAA